MTRAPAGTVTTPGRRTRPVTATTSDDAVAAGPAAPAALTAAVTTGGGATGSVRGRPRQTSTETTSAAASIAAVSATAPRRPGSTRAARKPSGVHRSASRRHHNGGCGPVDRSPSGGTASARCEADESPSATSPVCRLPGGRSAPSRPGSTVDSARIALHESSEEDESKPRPELGSASAARSRWTAVSLVDGSARLRKTVRTWPTVGIPATPGKPRPAICGRRIRLWTVVRKCPGAALRWPP